MTDIPEWALEKANWFYAASPLINTLQVFACYIAEHEDEPVDPLLIEAREIVARWHEETTMEWARRSPESYRTGRLDGEPEIKQALAALRRGIELGKEGAA